VAISARRKVVQLVKAASARFPRQSPLVWSVRRHEGRIALTFDDGPTDLTLQVLECLAQHGTKATFFVLGNQVGQRPNVLRRILASGHEIGIHGYEHSTHNYYRQVQRCEQELSSFGVIPRIVRTPGCVIKPVLVLRLWWRRYPTVIHSFDAHDSMRLEGKWSGSAPDYSTIGGGDIILMHDDNALCVKDLPVLLNSIREKNLRAVTVSELIGLRRAQSGKMVRCG
jgi:peptidoglycan/xylan/chitin deacetylase (PgdA/CDA1 family)